MIEAHKNILLSLSLLLCISTAALRAEDEFTNGQINLEGQQEGGPIDSLNPQQQPRIIHNIEIVGHKHTSREAILSYIPYKIGEKFDIRNAKSKTHLLINNLYFGLKRFSNITVKTQLIRSDRINIYVIVVEKPILKETLIKGNIVLTDKEIHKKIDLNLPALEEGELAIIAQKIKKLYFEKGYSHATVSSELRIDPEDGHATALIMINEGKKPSVKRILFTGNKHVSDKILRGIALSKEDWVLSFFDKSGTYHPERLGADKHVIEQYYQNNGFLSAKVTDIEKTIDTTSDNMTLTFHIEEGPLYHIKNVIVPGNEIATEEQLLRSIPLQAGTLYSRQDITDSIKALEYIWGNYGYLFAHIEPSIDTDEEEKTVTITLASDLGSKVFLNKINIRGNFKTRDKIIRRKLLLEEGSLINNHLMEISKNNVASLGYFDPKDGVNWKINRLSEHSADLELFLKEVKTGNAFIQMGFGGSGTNMASPNSGLSVKGGFADRNLLGYGVNINIDASWARTEQTMLFHIDQPWLFDRPISGSFDAYHRRPTYDMLRHITPSAVNEKLTGASIGAGFIMQSRHFLCNGMQMRANTGFDAVAYEKLPEAAGMSPEKSALYQYILNKEFVEGKFAWLACYLEQDYRNHPIHTSRGHRWAITSKTAIPTLGHSIGFQKLTLDASWYTPIIGERDLIFRIRAFFGYAIPFKNHTIPYGELFHIGGPASVRGFLYGQVGPTFEGDSIGSKKAFFINAELVFPITPDLNMKGAVFYDGGSGFDNPYANSANRGFIQHNGFDYRHSVGFGVRMLSPMPVKIDWGFKIDPRSHESTYELHFGMTYDW